MTYSFDYKNGVEVHPHALCTEPLSLFTDTVRVWYCVRIHRERGCRWCYYDEFIEYCLTNNIGRPLRCEI